MTKATAPQRESSPVTNKETAVKHFRQSRKYTNIDRRREFLPDFPPGPEVQTEFKTPPPLHRQTKTRSRDVHEAQYSKHRFASRDDRTAARPSSSEGRTSMTASSVALCRMVLLPPSSFQNLSRSFPGRIASECTPWSAASRSLDLLVPIVIDQATTLLHPGIHSILSTTNHQRILKPAHFPPRTFQDFNTLKSCASLPFLEKQARIPTSTEDCEPAARNQHNSMCALDHHSSANRERWTNLIQIIPAQTGMMCLACPEDRGMLNEHLIFVRQQIEFFQASVDDIMSHTRGRSKSIAPLQVGIRCRHCSHIPSGQRRKGSTYFPSTLMGIYQSAQNISVEHLQSGVCLEMPEEVKKGLSTTKAAKTAASGIGKAYWAESARSLGFVDTDDGIRYATTLVSQPLAFLH